MVHFNDKSGFTLIEVILAVAIIGILFGPILVTQGTMMQSIGMLSRRLRAVLAAQELLVETQYDDKAPEQKSKSLKPLGIPGSMAYKEEPAKISALKDFKDIVMKKVSMEWRDGVVRRTDELVTFVFKPKKKEA